VQEQSVGGLLCTYQHKQASGLGVNNNNLVRIKCNYVHVQPSLQICCLNPRSTKNKALSLSDYIVTHDYDIVALTVTWLGTSVDKKCIVELVPSGYNMKHIPLHGSRKEGGVALLKKINSILSCKEWVSDIVNYYTYYCIYLYFIIYGTKTCMDFSFYCRYIQFEININ